MSKETETDNQNLPTQKTPEPESFTGKFYQTFKEEFMSIIFKLFKVWRGGIASKLILQGQLTLTPKPDKNTIRKLLGQYSW